MNAVFHRYPSREALAEALAAGVAAVLAGGIATTGAATLAVSGGTTPQLFLDMLSRAEIDWSAVTVTLVDERWVPEGHERSNAGFLRRHFLKGPAGAARFEPLYAETPEPEDALDALNARIGGLHHPFDAVVLGMGADGHTASFFPGADTLAEALDPANPRPLSVLRAKGAGEPRISLTLARLLEAHFLALHIEGDEKLGVLETAKAPGPVEELPVRAVLRAAREKPLEVFWAPSGGAA
ncbi:6-phosphogluconolactonase [Aureimonas sp. Leaf454]|uniref:6-phosphogluconolactonase n=1 Tax=Aureimonas sp. Leaf454 TaxID=1736381 RepID=UPI00070179EA|nr:6-phosphogluconolactonase [Aureimonas sp. Leaf454]KQT52363.1 6-phosphogluconolactonase [Aureimonas sp. Leaf454]